MWCSENDGGEARLGEIIRNRNRIKKQQQSETTKITTTRRTLTIGEG